MPHRGKPITIYHRRGEHNRNAKLTEGIVREIRRLYATGAYTQAALGRQFGLTKQLVHTIVHRLAWSAVPDAE